MTTEVTASLAKPQAGRTALEQAARSPPTATIEQERERAAARLVERFSLWSGVAGLIPVPVIDVAAIAGLQLEMLRRLSQLYGVAFSANRGKSVVATLMGSLIPASSGVGVASALKTVPAVGTAVGTLTMSGVAAGATYAIGKVFIQHFASGGTLLDFDPPDHREFLKAHKETWSGRFRTGAAASGVVSPPQPGLARTTREQAE